MDETHTFRAVALALLGTVFVGCGGGGSSASSSGGAGTAAPTGLSYSSPSTAVVGTATTLNSSVTGTATSYSISPNLPSGLSFDSSTGTISGTPTAVAPQATYIISASNSGGSTTFSLVLTVNPAAPTALSYVSPAMADVGVSLSLAPTVTGTVTSYAVVPSLPAGLALNMTSGVISGSPSAVAAQATYTVTASNVTGNTQFPLTLTVVLTAPTALSYGTISPLLVGKAVAITPTVSGAVSQYGVSPALPAGLTISTSSGAISGTPTASSAASNYTVTASNSVGNTTAVLNLEVDTGPTISLSVSTNPSAGINYYWKTTDGQLLGSTRNAQATWLLPQGPGFHFAYVLVSDGNGNCSEARMAVNSDSFGAGTLKPNAAPTAKPAYSIAGGCAALRDPFFYLPNFATQPPPSSSQIISMSATYNGAAVGQFQAVFPNNLSGSEPSNNYLAADQFLTYLGEDTALSGCQYYQAIQAVSGCDGSGNITSGALTNFTQWRALSGVEAPNTGTPTYFVNAVDLNLTREHHALLWADNTGEPQLSAYVCNHLGPLDGTGHPTAVSLPPTSDQQPFVDAAVADAVAGKNSVACVAMDFVLVNGNKFVRFFVYGPSGELLTSVNLDGRGEKYVPHVCIACHGGNGIGTPPNPAYAGNAANVKAYFLPFDIDNFSFSAQSNYTEVAQDMQIFNLNNNLNMAPATNETSAPVTSATIGLFNGWYHNGENFSYVPGDWSSPNVQLTANLNTSTVYTDVVARSCRTCHTALVSGSISYDWDTTVPDNFISPTPSPPPTATYFDAFDYVCTTSPTMPNSLVAFNRFWDSVANHASNPVIPDQPAEFSTLYNYYNSGTPGACTVP